MVESSPAMPRPPRRVNRRPPGRPRKTAFSVEAITAAAITVLDEGGVVGLSMRRVAEQLGTGPASLYAYVASKEELLELVFDELIGRIPLPEPDPERWREQITELARALHAELVAHRDAALAGLGVVPTTPKALAATEAVVAILAAGGLTDRAVALGLDTLLLYVIADAFEQGSFVHGGMDRDELAAYYEDMHRFLTDLPSARFPTIARFADVMVSATGDERFAFGLDIVISGMEAVSARERAAVASGRP